MVQPILKTAKKATGFASRPEDDISGDYNEYSEIMEQEEEGGRIVTLKGNDGAIYCMTWTDGGYSYAVDIDMDGNGMPAYDALILAAGIK